MAISQEKAQQLCSTTEWNTLENSFPPRLGELAPAVLKKQANRVRRFLEQEKKASSEGDRVAMLAEALERLEQARPQEEQSEDKLAARREKEKAARERNKAVRERRTEVKSKLKEKADKEKLEKEGPPSEDGKEKKSGKGLRAQLQAAAAPRSQGKIGTRKV
jgi:hypothetical protein